MPCCTFIIKGLAGFPLQSRLMVGNKRSGFHVSWPGWPQCSPHAHSHFGPWGIHLGGYSQKKTGEVGCLVISNLCCYGSIPFLFLAHLLLLSVCSLLFTHKSPIHLHQEQTWWLLFDVISFPSLGCCPAASSGRNLAALYLGCTVAALFAFWITMHEVHKQNQYRDGKGRGEYDTWETFPHETKMHLPENSGDKTTALKVHSKVGLQTVGMSEELSQGRRSESRQDWKLTWCHVPYVLLCGCITPCECRDSSERKIEGFE